MQFIVSHIFVRNNSYCSNIILTPRILRLLLLLTRTKQQYQHCRRGINFNEFQPSKTKSASSLFDTVTHNSTIFQEYLKDDSVIFFIDSVILFSIHLLRISALISLIINVRVIKAFNNIHVLLYTPSLRISCFNRFIFTFKFWYFWIVNIVCDLCRYIILTFGSLSLCHVKYDLIFFLYYRKRIVILIRKFMFTYRNLTLRN